MALKGAKFRSLMTKLSSSVVFARFVKTRISEKLIK